MVQLQRPNILLITTDQQHWRLMSCAGERYIETPNLDRLASEGVRFDRVYTTNPVCVPARYSFMSGYMPHVFNGMEDNFKGQGDATPLLREWIDTPPLGHLFKNAGYDTVLAGKTHVEDVYSISPEQETALGFRCLHRDIRDQCAEACAEFLKQPHHGPFLLWASFDQPHDICMFLKHTDAPLLDADVGLPDNFAPTENESDWMRDFRDGTLGDEDTFELGLNRRFARAASEWNAETWKQYRSQYRYYMREADRYVGIVLDALDASEYARSTVVLFTSDHGEHDGAHGLTMKRSFYEESIHVPMIIRTPHRKNAGFLDERHLVCNGLDLIPTICDFAGIPVPEQLPGRSVRPLVEGSEVEEWREYVVSQTRGGRMLRSARFKYCLYSRGETSEEELYDLDNDPLEMVNLEGNPDYSETLEQHREHLQKWMLENRDQKGLAYLAK